MVVTNHKYNNSVANPIFSIAVSHFNITHPVYFKSNTNFSREIQQMVNDSCWFASFHRRMTIGLCMTRGRGFFFLQRSVCITVEIYLNISNDLYNQNMFHIERLFSDQHSNATQPQHKNRF